MSLVRLGALALCFAFSVSAQAQFIALDGSGNPENFDTLASSGTSTVLPSGWYLSELDDNANTSYTAGDGTTPSGDTYSFGATGSSERALGGLMSGSLVPIFGARIQNTSGSSFSDLPLQYVGEQWRLGTAGRQDRLDFQYSLNAASVSDAAATWIDANSLDFVAPVSAGALGALNGNAPANRLAISGTLTGINLAPGATLWIRWLDFAATSADDGLAIDDLSFGTPVDLPPALTSTAPLDDAINVPVDQAVRLTFSEAVDIADGTLSFVCNGQPVSHTRSAGPVEYLLTPTSLLPFSASCEVAIPAAAVTDRDGASDSLSEAVALNFITTADLPPSVVSTSPADGAQNAPAVGSIEVRFSEAVSLGSTAFSLSCAESGSVALSFPSSGTVINATPAAPLSNGELCSFSVHAAQVSDASLQTMLADLSISFRIAAGASGYYAQVNTSSPSQLRCSLHEIIDDHTVRPYEWVVLEEADAAPDDVCAAGAASGQNYILDIYRNRCYAKPSQRANSTNSGETTYNREHTWPKSLGFPNESSPPHTDTHMLHLSASDYNSDRGNKPFDNCTSNCTALPTDSNDGRSGTNFVAGSDGNAGTFEVWDGMKGNMARAVFYLAIRYEGDAHSNGTPEPDLELTDNRAWMTASGANGKFYMGVLTTLMAWHAADPVDARELERNEVVFGIQGNRNPFVDHPEWASLDLFTSSQPTTCELNTTLPPEVFQNGFE
ncbi:MAG: Extracellular ribonuclease precursor [Alphaproteobacteria bacterium ADurb.BinA280]|nr:MAG: Extracellular ribonuclease precursor [Alphaproteobacteria bacterium ADurb.BinA280]